MNFKKVFLISVNLALYMCLFFGCNNTSDLQTETTTQTQITEKATAEKKEISIAEAKSKITTSDVKEAIVSGTFLTKVYTPEIASINYDDETNNSYCFMVKGTVAGYFGEYNENFASGTYDARMYVNKESGNVSGGFVDYHSK